MSIGEIKSEIKRLENEIEYYLDKKRINYYKTQTGSIQYKDVVSSTNSIFDKHTHYVIKDEEYDDTIYSLQEELNVNEKYYIKEMKRMAKYDEIGLICYLREEEHKNWKEIDKTLHRSFGYSKVKYSRYKKDCQGN